MKLTTIVSTGDPGAALGAHKAAQELGLKIGGWTAATPPPELKSTLAPRMAARLNVQDSDGTLIVSFVPELAAGTPAAYADEAVAQQRRQSLHIVLPERGRTDIEGVRKVVLAWIAEEKIATLHVTGPREQDEPGIQQAVRDALVWIFEDEVRPRATFAGVDRSAAPEPLAGVVIDRVCRETGVTFCNEDPPLVDTIAHIAADLPSRPLRPPLTTEDALRQIAATGDDDSRLFALAELARRHGEQPAYIAINPANVDAAIAAGLDVQFLATSATAATPSPTDPVARLPDAEIVRLAAELAESRGQPVGPVHIGLPGDNLSLEPLDLGQWCSATEHGASCVPPCPAAPTPVQDAVREQHAAFHCAADRYDALKLEVAEALAVAERDERLGPATSAGLDAERCNACDSDLASCDCLDGDAEVAKPDHEYLSAGDTPYADGDRCYTGCVLCGRPRKEHRG